MLQGATVSIVHDDSRQAGVDAGLELIDRLGRQPDLVLLFVSTKYDVSAVLAGLYEEFSPDVKLVGCSSYAEINNEEALTESVTAMGLVLGKVQCLPVMVEDAAAGSFGVGEALARQIKDFEPNLFILLPDGITLNSTPILQGMQSVLGEDFPIVGGVAADDVTFKKTYEFFGNRAISGGAVGVALKGDIKVATAARSGFYPVGATRTVTKVENRKVILEIDGVPALDLYKEYLGTMAAKLETAGIEFPLGIVGEVEGRKKLPEEQILTVRAIQGVDEARGGLLSSGDVAEGTQLRMTRATKDDLIEAAAGASQYVTEQLPDGKVALLFDCAGRKLVLGTRFKDEAAKALAVFKDIPTIGFYTYGELSPVQGKTLHHDETFTVALLQG
ncbi:MAG TPA: FIST N-terminal domain-containing protein [Polyangium sp.]|jgi:hypothetical protein|nr:FIST N-terminal domain-containing protein [Polyangium sp.]